MDRSKAIEVCKKIQLRVPELSPQGISITDSGPSNGLSTGCIINFKGLSEEYREQVRQIVKACSLECSEKNDEVTNYSLKVS